MIPGSGGPLIKMLILSFLNSERTIPNLPFPFFEVMYNPENFDRSYKTQYYTRQAPGDAGSQQVFDRIQPQQFSFDFLFDGTGASPPGGLASLTAAEPVQIKVERFLKVTRDYVGTIHRTPFLKIIWGPSFIVDCVLVSADVQYTLFNPQGIPLRAKIKATFHENKDQSLNLRELLPFSPDLTHQREVEAEDNLSNLSFEVYDDPAYYLQLARHNKLKNFRRLRQGKQLDFPPIKDNKE